MRYVDLLEKRRNPDINQKVSLIDSLQKYKGQKDIFVSFTDDVGKNTNIKSGSSYNYSDVTTNSTKNITGAKIGINPGSTYATPAGIYTYPIDYVLELEGDVPFANDAPYVWVVKANCKILDLDTYSESEYQSDVEKLFEIYAETKFVKQWRSFEKADQDAYNYGKDRSTGGRIWYITRSIAISLTYTKERKKAELKWEKYKESDEAKKHVLYDEDKKGFIESELDDVENTCSPSWNKVFRSLGYGCVADLKDKGIIHGNEPTQCVFFSVKDFKTIDLVRNIKPKEKPSEVEILTRNPEKFLQMMRKNMISDEQLSSILELARDMPLPRKALAYYFKEVSAKDMPEKMKKFFRNNLHFFQFDNQNCYLDDYDFSDDEILQMSTSHYKILLHRFKNVDQKVKDQLLQNPATGNILEELPFMNDKDKWKYYTAFPDIYNYIKGNILTTLMIRFLIEHPDLIEPYLNNRKIFNTRYLYPIYFKKYILNSSKNKLYGFLDHTVKYAMSITRLGVEKDYRNSNTIEGLEACLNLTPEHVIDDFFDQDLNRFGDFKNPITQLVFKHCSEKYQKEYIEYLNSFKGNAK